MANVQINPRGFVQIALVMGALIYIAGLYLNSDGAMNLGGILMFFAIIAWLIEWLVAIVLVVTSD